MDLRVEYFFFTGVLIFLLASPSYSASYQELRTFVESGSIPDSSYLKDLPKPQTAGEFWLRSKVQPTLPKALSDLRKSIQQSRSENLSVYLTDWLELMLFDVKQNVEFKFLNYHLDRLPDDTGGEAWLLAGKLALKKDKIDFARKWFARAAEFQTTQQEAHLNQVRVALRAQDYSRAKTILDQYLRDYREGSRPEYWFLRGKLHQKQGSDSEAYLAFSHMVNHYPENPLTDRAEQRLKGLSLPKTLVKPAETSPRESKTSSHRSSSSNASGSKVQQNNTDQFRIQVGSFVNRNRAGGLRRRLRERFDNEVVIREARVRGRKYYRVQVKGFQSRGRARNMLNQLKSEGFDGYIVKGEDQ